MEDGEPELDDLVMGFRKRDIKSALKKIEDGQGAGEKVKMEDSLGLFQCPDLGKGEAEGDESVELMSDGHEEGDKERPIIEDGNIIHTCGMDIDIDKLSK